MAIMPDFRDFVGTGTDELLHSAKGTTWKKKKYKSRSWNGRRWVYTYTKKEAARDKGGKNSARVELKAKSEYKNAYDWERNDSPRKRESAENNAVDILKGMTSGYDKETHGKVAEYQEAKEYLEWLEKAKNSRDPMARRESELYLESQRKKVKQLEKAFRNQY